MQSLFPSSLGGEVGGIMLNSYLCLGEQVKLFLHALFYSIVPTLYLMTQSARNYWSVVD